MMQYTVTSNRGKIMYRGYNAQVADHLAANFKKAMVSSDSTGVERSEGPQNLDAAQDYIMSDKTRTEWEKNETTAHWFWK